MLSSVCSRLAVASLLLVGNALPSPGAESNSRGEQDIHALIALYEQAIETQNIEQFNQVKPNLSKDERGRLERSFKSIDSHQVEITVVRIEADEENAVAVLRRRDTLNAGSAGEIISAFPQTLNLVRVEGSWRIESIGR